MFTWRSLISGLGVTLSLLGSVTSAHALPYYQEVLADNPIAYYRLGEASGTTAADSAPPPQDGTYNGAFTLGTTGALDPADTDTAVTFPGAGGNVTTTLSFDPAATNFSMELWVNVTGIGEDKSLISQTDVSGTGRSVVYLDYSAGTFGVSSFLAGADQFSGFGVLSTATWYHIVLTSTDNGATSTLQWYLNGTPFNNIAGVPIESTLGTFILASAKDGTGVLNGVLDEVAIYTTALSAAQVQEHYDSRFEVVPEPGTLCLAGIGSVLALLALRRRN